MNTLEALLCRLFNYWRALNRQILPTVTHPYMIHARMGELNLTLTRKFSSLRRVAIVLKCLNDHEQLLPVVTLEMCRTRCHILVVAREFGISELIDARDVEACYHNVSYPLSYMYEFEC